jgi:hypothetical protein
MKFNYPATILMGTVALSSIFNAGQANAIDCKTISVPWSWQVTKTGKSHASVNAENPPSGDSFSNVPDSDSLGGAFIVRLLFNEPRDYCKKLDNVPTATTLRIIGSFTGSLSTNFFPLPGVPGLSGPFAGASASVNGLRPFNTERLPLGGTREINQRRETVKTVRNGSRISFDGDLDAFAYKGLDGGSGFSLASAQLNVNGFLAGSTRGTVRYTVHTPEPLTMLASATALGFGAFFKRQHSKKSQKS